jgi:hypothetical protein
MHPMQAAIEVMRPSTLRRRDPDHVVTGVEPLGLAAATEVIVGAGHALVAKANDWLIAAIAYDTGVFRTILVSFSWWFFIFLIIGNHLDAVDWTLHVSKSKDELIVGSDGHFVQILIGPGQAEVLPSQGRIDGDQLLTEVGQRCADVAVDQEPTNLGFASRVFEDGLEGDSFGHFDRFQACLNYPRSQSRLKSRS